MSLFSPGFCSNHEEISSYSHRHVLSLWHLSVILSNAERGKKDKMRHGCHSQENTVKLGSCDVCPSKEKPLPGTGTTTRHPLRQT